MSKEPQPKQIEVRFDQASDADTKGDTLNFSPDIRNSIRFADEPASLRQTKEDSRNPDANPSFSLMDSSASPDAKVARRKQQVVVTESSPRQNGIGRGLEIPASSKSLILTSPKQSSPEILKVAKLVSQETKDLAGLVDRRNIILKQEVNTNKPTTIEEVDKQIEHYQAQLASLRQKRQTHSTALGQSQNGFSPEKHSAYIRELLEKSKAIGGKAQQTMVAYEGRLSKNRRDGYSSAKSRGFSARRQSKIQLWEEQTPEANFDRLREAYEVGVTTGQCELTMSPTEATPAAGQKQLRGQKLDLGEENQDQLDEAEKAKIYIEQTMKVQLHAGNGVSREEAKTLAKERFLRETNNRQLIHGILQKSTIVRVPKADKATHIAVKNSIGVKDLWNIKKPHGFKGTEFQWLQYAKREQKIRKQIEEGVYNPSLRQKHSHYQHTVNKLKADKPHKSALQRTEGMLGGYTKNLKNEQSESVQKKTLAKELVKKKASMATAGEMHTLMGKFFASKLGQGERTGGPLKQSGVLANLSPGFKAVPQVASSVASEMEAASSASMAP